MNSFLSATFLPHLGVGVASTVNYAGLNTGSQIASNTSFSAFVDVGGYFDIPAQSVESNPIVVSSDGVVTGTSGDTTPIAFYRGSDDIRSHADGSEPVITVASAELTVDSISPASGPYRPGDTIVVSLSNGVGTETLNRAGISIPITAQDANSLTFDVPDPFTHGSPASNNMPFGSAITFTVTNGTDTPTFQLTLSPPATHEVGFITALTGYWAESEFAAVEVGDQYYAPIISGAVHAEGAVPQLTSEQNFDVQVRDVALTGLWATGFTTVTIPAANSAATGVPAITGTAQEDQVLTADTSGIADANGLGPFSYQWARNGTNISGANSSTYTLTQADVGATITVSVSFTDGAGYSEGPLTSAATSAVTNVNDPPTGTVTIDNTTPVVGNLLTASNTLADEDGLGTLNYQWRRSGTNISGSTSQTYTVVAGDIGSTISVVISYTDQQGTAESVASAETSSVTATSTAPVMPNDTSVNVNENTTYVGVFAATSGSTPITYTISGTDSASFSINASTGRVDFVSAPDYETKNSYVFVVTATNGAGNDSQTITVNVQDVAEGTSSVTTPSHRTVRLSNRGPITVPRFQKDTSDIVDFLMDFSGILDSDTISTIAVETTNITLDSSSLSGTKAVQLWVSQGYGTAMITVLITTPNGRRFERSIEIVVGEY